MDFKLIVFDWDGTLYDSEKSIVACLQQAAKEMQVEIPSSASICSAVGLSFEELVKRILPQVVPDKVALLRKTFNELLDKDHVHKPVLFNGAKDTLQWLRNEGYWLAVATGKGRSCFEKNATSLQVRDFFTTTRCGDEAFSKPHPQMLLEIIDEIGVSKQHVLMIGDTEYDLQLAANAGVDALAVDYGMHDRQQLLKHEILDCISDIRDLPGWLKRP